MRGLLALLLVLVPAAAAAAKTCPDTPINVGKLTMFEICHCTSYAYPELAEQLDKEGVRIARKDALWKKEFEGRGVAKCSITLAWKNPKDRRNKALCKTENVDRISAAAIHASPDTAISTTPLKCE